MQKDPLECSSAEIQKKRENEPKQIKANNTNNRKRKKWAKHLAGNHWLSQTRTADKLEQQVQLIKTTEPSMCLKLLTHETADEYNDRGEGLKNPQQTSKLMVQTYTADVDHPPPPEAHPTEENTDSIQRTLKPCTIYPVITSMKVIKLRVWK